MTDFISLPFYDLFHENGHVPEIRKKLPPLLAGVRRSILEIGAGTGLITTSMADWTPAEIFALEPSSGMRGVLLSRLNSRPELLKRVTVLSCDALSVELDEPIEAAVMINVMYALDPDYRKRLWPTLAARLEPPVSSSSPGAMVVRRNRVLSRSWAPVRWVGTLTRFYRRFSSRTGRRPALATSTGSPKKTRSSAKKKSSARPIAPPGT